MNPKCLVAEGHDDREFLEQLLHGRGYDVFPKKGEGGLDRDRKTLVQAAAQVVAQIRTHVVIALDLDRDTEPQLFAHAQARLRENGVDIPASGHRAGGTSVHVVPLGLGGDPLMNQLGVALPAMDDYLLAMLWNTDTMTALLSSRQDCASLPADLVRHKMESMAALLRNQQVQVIRAKQHLDFFRAVTGFRASPAELAASIMRSAPAPAREAICAGLLSRIP